ncbi:hypothetical protein AHAS_Ahas13G0347300 [Arachis hypogaea]
MHSMWPGIFGNSGGSPFMVSQMSKRAVQASHFMLQMMQAPLYVKETQPESENGSTEMPQVIDSCVEVLCDCGEEGLALRIAKVVGNHLLFVIGLSFTNPSYAAALEPTVPVFTFLFSVIMWSIGPFRIAKLVANAIEATFSKGDAIAIDMQMTASAVIIYLAIVLAGCGVVSIANSFAPKEIATCLHISKAKGTFTQDFISRGGKKFSLYR